jgi:pimeloyl-ACP methyl ester carboxylesterase
VEIGHRSSTGTSMRTCTGENRQSPWAKEVGEGPGGSIEPAILLGPSSGLDPSSRFARAVSSCFGEALMYEVSIDGLNIAYQDCGHAGRPLVLVHGFTGNRHDFRDHYDALCELGRTVAYDHRGHGDSANAGAADAYSFARLVADLKSFVDSLGLDEFDLLGHSMGGMVALRYVLAHPSDVGSLVLMNTSARAPDGFHRFVFTAGGELAIAEGMERLAEIAGSLAREDPNRPAASIAFERKIGSDAYWGRHRDRMLVRLRRRRRARQRQPEPVAPGEAQHIHGLFEVTDGVYQVRGYDLSNMTIIEGEQRLDRRRPAHGARDGERALALAERISATAVVAVIFTHSHIDHFGGIEAVLPDAGRRVGAVRVIAPRGFVEEATSENVLAGIAMAAAPRSCTAPAGARAARPRRFRPRQTAGAGAFNSAADRSIDRTPQPMDDRRRPLRLPVRPRVRGAGRAHVLPARQEGLLRRRDRVAHHAQPLHPARRQGARRAALERLHRRSDRSSSTTPRWCSPATTGRCGATSGSWTTWRSSATPTSTSTTRRCASPTPAHAARDRRDASSCRRRWRRRFANRGYYGTVATTPRRSTSGTSAGTTATRPTSIRCRRRPIGAKYVEAWAAPDAVLARRAGAFDERRVPLGRDPAEPPRLRGEPDNPRGHGAAGPTYDQLGYQAESGPWRDVYLTGAHELRRGVRAGRRHRRPRPTCCATCPSELFFDAMATRLDGPKAAGRGSAQLHLHRPRTRPTCCAPERRPQLPQGRARSRRRRDPAPDARLLAASGHRQCGPARHDLLGRSRGRRQPSEADVVLLADGSARGGFRHRHSVRRPRCGRSKGELRSPSKSAASPRVQSSAMPRVQNAASPCVQSVASLRVQGALARRGGRF